MTPILLGLAAFPALLYGLHILSYGVLKRLIVEERRWGLNICCGATDGGGVNADIVRHDPSLPRFRRIKDIYRLPFRTRTFDTVLCSHTIEHVDDPDRFYRELRRVGRKVVLVLPPLWDPLAAFNVFEHRWLFLTLRKRHETLPPKIPLPLSRTVQSLLGQLVKA